MKVVRRPLWVEVAILTLLLLVALTCFHAGPAHASIDGVSIIPPSPTDQDSIVVHFSGTFFDGCWRFQNGTCDKSEEAFTIDAYMTDGWWPGSACPTVLTGYLVTCALGRLAPGDYTIIATQHGDSIWRPEFQKITVPFKVSALVPAAPATWSAIKTRY